MQSLLILGPCMALMATPALVQLNSANKVLPACEVDRFNV